MNFFIILLTFKASVSSSFTPDNTRSSFLHTVEDYYLQGHVSHRQMSSSVLSCGQLCLRNRPLCLSLNYDKEGTKICELNDEGIDITQTGVTSLVPKRGYIFGQLLNLTNQHKTDSESLNTGKKEHIIPKGYAMRPGDCPGNDIWYIHGSVSLEECARRCNGNPACVSFMFYDGRECYPKTKTCPTTDKANAKNFFYDKIKII